MRQKVMIEAVEKHRDDLRDLADSDLPASDLAEALLDIVDSTEA
jgi:hypothetical protein